METPQYEVLRIRIDEEVSETSFNLVKKPEEKEFIQEVVAPLKKETEEPVLKGFAAPKAPAPTPTAKAEEKKPGLFSKLIEFVSGLFKEEEKPQPKGKGKKRNNGKYDNRRGNNKNRNRKGGQQNRNNRNQDKQDNRNQSQQKSEQNRDNRNRNQDKRKAKQAQDNQNQTQERKEQQPKQRKEEKVAERRQRRSNRKRVRVQKTNAVEAGQEATQVTEQQPQAKQQAEKKPVAKQERKPKAKAKPAKTILAPHKAKARHSQEKLAAKRRLIAKLATGVEIAKAQSEEIESRYPESDAKFEQEHPHLAPAEANIEQVLDTTSVTSESTTEVEPQITAVEVQVEDNETLVAEESTDTKKSAKEATDEIAAEQVEVEASAANKVEYPGFASAPMAKPPLVESISVGTPEVMPSESRAEVYVSARVGGSASATNSATSEATKTL